MSYGGWREWTPDSRGAMHPPGARQVPHLATWRKGQRVKLAAKRRSAARARAAAYRHDPLSLVPPGEYRDHRLTHGCWPGACPERERLFREGRKAGRV